MSRGTKLQEMEVGNVKQSKTAANANAKPGDAMPTLSGVTPGQSGTYEDLGGPTPENYKPDDDSAKLNTPGKTLKQVKDVVNKGAKPADPMKGMKEDEEIVDEVIEEEEVTTDEVVAEEETTEEVEVDIEEDVNALFGGEDLSEEFKEKKSKIIPKDKEINVLKITVRDLTDQDIKSRNLKKGSTGVVIVDIANRSPLINLLSVDDVIIEVQKKSVKDSSDLNKIVSDIFKKGEKTLLLTVINKNNQRNYLGVKIN